MRKTLNDEFDKLIKEGSKVGLDSKKYRELFAQYVVLFNQLDPRNYFSEKGGIGVDGNFYEEKTQRMKDQLWKNPLWRGFIRLLQKTGLMKIAKEHGIAFKIKKAVVKKLN